MVTKAPSEQFVSSEPETKRWAAHLAMSMGDNDLVLLSGPLGAGKSFVARVLIESKFPKLLTQGSPTFPIAHDYGEALHVDLYRVESESEIHQRGLDELLESQKFAIVEWSDRFPEFIQKLCKYKMKNFSRKAWEITIRFGKTPEGRVFQVRQIQ